MYTAYTDIRVRYGETDKMGVLYYGNYALFLEQGRTDAMRQLGITYKSLEETGIIMPVIEMNIKYYRPARYDDLITVKTIIKELKPSDMQIRFYSELYNENGKKLNDSVITLVFYDPAHRKKVTVPKMMWEKLSPHLEGK